MARPESITAKHRAVGAPRSYPRVSRFWNDRAGATAIEYGLIAGLTFLVIAGTLKIYAERMADVYNFIGASVGKAF